MFVKIANGQVEKAPYTIGEFRKANPNVSFPKDIPITTLEANGIFVIKEVPQPEINTNTHTYYWEAELVNNVWTQVWYTSQLPEEIAAKNIRQDRDRLLTETDWTQVADSPVDKQAWAVYRQALRDIPSQVGFPWDVEYPEKP